MEKRINDKRKEKKNEGKRKERNSDEIEKKTGKKEKTGV